MSRWPPSGVDHVDVLLARQVPENAPPDEQTGSATSARLAPASKAPMSQLPTARAKLRWSPAG